MRGTRTRPEKVEEIKALSLIHSPQILSEKLGIPSRTIYAILARRDNAKIEGRREERRLELVDKAFETTDAEIERLRSKMALLLDAIGPEKIARARLTELSTSFGILFDKTRLLKGESTQNVSSLSRIVEMAHSLDGPPLRDKTQVPKDVTAESCDD